MSKVMSYKGYAARIDFSADDACFVGHIAGIQDVVGFHGESVDELKAAFTDAVEDYLETCRRIDRQPQKPYSGNLMLRVAPELHAAVATTAQLSGKSVNQWAAETLRKAAES